MEFPGQVETVVARRGSGDPSGDGRHPIPPPRVTTPAWSSDRQDLEINFVRNHCI